MLDKGKEKLNKSISFEIKSIQKQILDLCELVVSNVNWDPFRKKILDITSDAGRNIEAEIKYNYSIEHTPSNICEDVIEVKPSQVKGKLKFKNKE